MTSKQIAERHIELISAEQWDDWAELLAEDVVVEFTYAPAGHTQGVSGRDGWVGFMNNIRKYFRDIRIFDGSVMAMEDPHFAIAEYRGEAVCIETNLPYTQRYFLILECHNGKITRAREIYNPLEVLKSIGEWTDGE